MTSPMTRIKKVLTKEFSPTGIRLERSPNGKISGWVISKSFEGQPAIDRQHRIWRLLDANLDPKDKERIVMIFTITPLERKESFAPWMRR